MIVKCDHLPVRELGRRVMRDGRGTRTYYEVLAEIPILLRTEADRDFANMVKREEVCVALFDMDSFDYGRAVDAGVPVPASWQDQHVYQISLKPLTWRDVGKKPRGMLRDIAVLHLGDVFI